MDAKEDFEVLDFFDRNWQSISLTLALSEAQSYDPEDRWRRLVQQQPIEIEPPPRRNPIRDFIYGVIVRP